MRLLKISLCTLLLSCSHSAFALFCPNNFNLIKPGDSLDSVIANCGKPDSQTTKDQPVEADTSEEPQEWVYYVQDDPTSPMTSRMTVAFDKGKVVNISLSGLSVGSVSLCPRGSVTIGDSIKSVTSACGKSALVNQASKDDKNAKPPPPDKMTVLNYSSQGSTVTFTFKNGVLMQP